MKKFLTLILILIISLLTCGFAGCGETQEEDNQVKPYVKATFYALEGYNSVTGIMRQTSAYGAQPYIVVETPELEGWYVTFSSDNEQMLTVDADGRCEVWRGGTCYVTVTYTNGVDKVCVDMSRGTIEVIYNKPATEEQIKSCLENTGHKIF